MLTNWKFWALALVLGASWATSLKAEEDSADYERAPAGTRCPSRVELVAIQEARAKLASIDASEEEADIDEMHAAALAASKLINPQASSYFYTSHPGAFHFPTGISMYGDSIELEDGSLWAVKDSDSLIVLDWLFTDTIVISPNHSFFSLYDYCLTNQDTGEAVRVNMILPYYYKCRHWIVAIDDYANRVYLEDGSVWDFSVFDSNVAHSWMIDDRVFIGINDGWLSNSRPNILINVETLTYIKANCIY